MSRIGTIWEKAQLFVAFHRDPARKKRAEPYLWPPKNGVAGLRKDAEDQEAFVNIQGHDRSDDVQLKLRSDRIIVRRDPETAEGWAGIEIEKHAVRVLVGDLWVRIDADGTITREAQDSTTYLEGDGAIIRVSEEAEILVSPDGKQMTRRTEERIEGISDEGVVSKKRKPAIGETK